MDPAAPDPTPDLAAVSDRLNALAAIKARAQATRRRVLRDERLDRHRITADLGAIEALADRLAALLAEPPAGPGPGGHPRRNASKEWRRNGQDAASALRPLPNCLGDPHGGDRASQDS